jgi:hypothetical protein
VKPVKLAALSRRVVKQTQQHVDRIENDQLRSHLSRLGLQRSQQASEIECAGLDHVRTHAGIDEIEMLLLEVAHVPSEGLRIGRHPARMFLECDKDARRAVVHGAANQDLEREDCLTAAWATHQQHRTPPRQSAGGDVVEALDAAGHLCKDFRPSFIAHGPLGFSQILPIKSRTTKISKSTPSPPLGK